MCLYVCILCMDIYVPKHTCSCTSMGRVCHVSMGNLVSMSVDVYLYMRRFMCVCVDMYMCILYDCFA